jgi:hypothetical protein
LEDCASAWAMASRTCRDSITRRRSVPRNRPPGRDQIRG